MSTTLAVDGGAGLWAVGLLASGGRSRGVPGADPRDIDHRGAVNRSTALTAFQLALTKGGQGGRLPIVILAGPGVVLIGGFVPLELACVIRWSIRLILTTPELRAHFGRPVRRLALRARRLRHIAVLVLKEGANG